MDQHTLKKNLQYFFLIRNHWKNINIFFEWKSYKKIQNEFLYQVKTEWKTKKKILDQSSFKIFQKKNIGNKTEKKIKKNIFELLKLLKKCLKKFANKIRNLAFFSILRTHLKKLNFFGQKLASS